MLRAHAPAFLYENGMTALPVDFRECRSDACADGPEIGTVTRSNQGLRMVAFTHVIDGRAGQIARTEAWGGNCSGPRAGNSTCSTGSSRIAETFARDPDTNGHERACAQ